MRGRKVIAVLILTMLIQFCLPPRLVMAVDDSADISAIYAAPMPYDRWYQADKAHLSSLIAEYKGQSRTLTAQLVKEWKAISAELGTALNNRYLEPERQYSVYGPNTSGKIHILSLAKYHRERLLTDLLNGKNETRQYPDRWSNNPAGIPSVSSQGFSPSAKAPNFGVTEVVSVVNEFDLPASTFRGISIFILPFNITGYAASSHSKFLPGREESIYLSASINNESPPLAATIAHELGHYIHYQYIGPYEQNQIEWRAFMNLIGQDDFNYPSNQYQDLTCEHFSEYFRMVYCSYQARHGMRYRVSAPNPLYSTYLFNGFSQLVEDLINQPDDSYYDVNQMRISSTDYLGRPVSFPVGVRSEQINTIVTTSPQLTFSSPVILNPGQPFNPILACFRFDSRATLIDYSRPKVNHGYVRYSFKLPKPGTYTLYVGLADASNNILKPMSFTIIYTP